MKVFLFTLLVIIAANTYQKFLTFIMNSYYNIKIYFSKPLQAQLKFLNSSIQSASTVADLVVIFNQVFKGYQANPIKMFLDSMFQPSFSTVMAMNREVCRGDAAVNFYMRNAYVRVLNIKPVYTRLFGIWNTFSGLSGHCMVRMVMADSSVILLDYQNNYPLKNINEIKQYYINNSCNGKGTIADIVTIDYPDVKSFGEK
jgi:hypothetical protein